MYCPQTGFDFAPSIFFVPPRSNLSYDVTPKHAQKEYYLFQPEKNNQISLF